MSFKDKVVLVTGSGAGIGAATALIFTENGANIVIADSDEESANKTAEKCKIFGNKVLVIKADVSKKEDAKKIIEETINSFGKLDVLVNNAGIVRLANLLSGTIMDSYDDVMNVNLRSVILMTDLASKYLIESKGCIVNVSSIVSLDVIKGRRYPVYTISKVGVDCFTKLSAAELGQFGVRVNAVNPGPIKTNILSSAGLPDEWNRTIAATVLKKGSEPREIAELIMYLASDKAVSITGSTILIDNGKTLV